MKRLSKSVVCIFLTVVIVISILPISAFAATYRVNYWSYPVPSRTLSNGCSGIDVRWLQCALNGLTIYGDIYGTRLNAPKLNVDGDFGPQTKTAVLAFQNKYHLQQDGLFGEKSRTVMKIVLRTSYSDPAYVSDQQTTTQPDPEPKISNAINYNIDGVYYIRNKQTNKYLDVCGGKNENRARIVQYHFHGDANQQFEIKYENGFYKIYTKLGGTKRCLDLHSSSEANTNDTDLQLFNALSSYKEQNFIFKRLEDGSYEIGSACSNGEKVLEVANSSYSDSAAIQIWQSDNDRINDDWYLEPVYYAEVEKTVPDGVYYIRNKQTNKYLDVMGGTAYNNAKVVQYKFHGDANQQFLIKHVDGFYKIYAMGGAGSMCFDLSSSSEANKDGTDLKIYQSVSKCNQQRFRIRDLGDGSYEIGSVCSFGDKVLEVDNASRADCATVHIWQRDNSRINDDWYLEPVEVKKAQIRVKSKHQYDSMDDAAIDFIKAYDGMSVAQNREYGSIIVRVGNKYTFTNVIWGPVREEGSDIGTLGDIYWYEIIKASNKVAYVHTHGKEVKPINLVFSDVDLGIVDDHDNFEYAYLGNPNGDVYKYYKKDRIDWLDNYSEYISRYAFDTDFDQNSGEGIYE